MTLLAQPPAVPLSGHRQVGLWMSEMRGFRLDVVELAYSPSFSRESKGRCQPGQLSDSLPLNEELGSSSVTSTWEALGHSPVP